MPRNEEVEKFEGVVDQLVGLMNGYTRQSARRALWQCLDTDAQESLAYARWGDEPPEPYEYEYGSQAAMDRVYRSLMDGTAPLDPYPGKPSPGSRYINPRPSVIYINDEEPASWAVRVQERIRGIIGGKRKGS